MVLRLISVFFIVFPVRILQQKKKWNGLFRILLKAQINKCGVKQAGIHDVTGIIMKDVLLSLEKAISHMFVVWTDILYMFSLMNFSERFKVNPITWRGITNIINIVLFVSVIPASAVPPSFLVSTYSSPLSYFELIG